MPTELADFELGTWIGRHQAFSIVAGKASAADIDCLRHIRDERLFKPLADTWDDFCSQHLNASRPHVNRMIRILEKYGPQYFALTQLTRVPPAVFDAIAPHLTEDGITLDGETFALSAENTEQVSAAVAEIRKRAELEGPAPQRSPFEVLERRFLDLIGRLESLNPALDEGQKSVVNGLMEQLLALSGQ